MHQGQCSLGVRHWEAVLLLLASSGAYACSPPPIYPNEEQRVRAQMRNADKVFIATLVRADRRPHGQPTELQTKSLVFRIDEVYKGKVRAGERYHTVTSGFGASCGVSAWPGTPFRPNSPVRYDAHKKISGRKRHIAVDTDGRLLAVNLTPADVADSTGAQMVLDALVKRWPWVKHLFGDPAYDRRTLLDKAAFLDFTVEVVRGLQGQTSFQV